MIFTASTLASATGGQDLSTAPRAAGPLTTDSRRLTPGSWFLALRGDRFDGHDFLAHAATAGCAGVVAEHVPPGWSLGAVVVPDTLRALQDIGRYARSTFDGPVVGITGSAGKTTTRVLVAEVAAEVGRVHHTSGNLNNHIGVPLTLCGIAPDAEVLVVEMGMNHPGEIALLQDIAQPSVRLITNVGAAHVEGCGSIAGVAAAKQELFDGARPEDHVLVNLDDPWIAAMPVPTGAHVVPYGRDGLVRLTDVSVDPERLQTRLRIELPTGVVRATLEVPGEHLAQNALAAAAVGFVLHVPPERIGAALSRFRPEGMRNRVERHGGVTILDDAYNANPVSMVAGLRTLAALRGARWAVLGDMLELGAEEDAAHAAVLAEAQALGLEHVLVTGDRMARAARNAAEAVVEVHPDAERLAVSLAERVRPGDAVLVKGSRGARMERVVHHLVSRPVS